MSEEFIEFVEIKELMENVKRNVLTEREKVLGQNMEKTTDTKALLKKKLETARFKSRESMMCEVSYNASLSRLDRLLVVQIGTSRCSFGSVDIK